MLDEKTVDYLDDVRRYGELLGRYDLTTCEGSDDTHTMFRYRYKEPYSKNSRIVTIYMEHGEYKEFNDRIEGPVFTEQDKQNYIRYEKVRREGLYNMFDEQARILTGLTKDEYLWIMKNYTALNEKYKDCVDTTSINNVPERNSKYIEAQKDILNKYNFKLTDFAKVHKNSLKFTEDLIKQVGLRLGHTGENLDEFIFETMNKYVRGV